MPASVRRSGKNPSPAKNADSTGQILQHPLTGPAIVAVLAMFAVLITLSPDAHGPGITCDEYYDVAAGKRLVQSFLDEGSNFFRAENIEQTYGPLTRHPPLGRWWLGWGHALADPAPDDLRMVSVVAGRIAPAMAYGLLIFLIGWATGRGGEPLRGTFSAAAVALTPRLFGHAHLATLDMFTATMFVAAIVVLPFAVSDPKNLRRAMLAGFVWGLALLTKMHGLLLVVPATVWFFWHFRWSALRIWAAWLITGLVTFFLGWPWLWHDSVGRLQEYLNTATDRQPLHAYYFGQVWNDVDVPWHYPWVLFAVTVPLGFLLLGSLGLWDQRRRLATDPLLSLTLASFIFVLLVFSLPNTPVYDGVRLFLMVFPLWTVFVGYGASFVVNRLKCRIARPFVAEALVGGFVLLQGFGIVAYHPFQLSHYSLLVGGLPGAERLGFETTYWGDAINGELLGEAHRAAPDATVFYAPHLAPFQAAAVEISAPELEGTHLLGWDPNQNNRDRDANYALVYRRQADWDTVAPLIANAEVVAEVSRQGVWLARLYRLSSSPSNSK